MKLQQWEAFEKHLDQALAHPLSPIYALSMQEDQERHFLLDQLREKLQSALQGDLLTAKSAEGAVAHLSARSLFGVPLIAIFDGDCAPFIHYRPGEKAYLILAASEPKALQALYTKQKSEMIWLDLTGEKPWEKKQRLERLAFKVFQKAGKRLSSAVCQSLMERAGENAAVLNREIEKLLCYLGEKTELTSADLNALGLPIYQEGGFAFAEQLIWSGGKGNLPVQDLSILLPLIGQLRYLLEQALVISGLKEQGKSFAEVGDELPGLKPRVLEKVWKRLESKPSSYFVHGLKALFMLELNAKNSVATPQILFDYFRGELAIISAATLS